MLRTLLATAGLLLLAPVAASAAPFGELPFQPLNRPGGCLQATGAPGELVRQTEDTAQFFTAAPTGLTAGAVVSTSGTAGCADVAAWPGGGGLLTFPVVSEIDDEVWVRSFLREPGQRWGEPVDILPPETGISSASFTSAVSERGDALVAESSIDAKGRVNLRLTRRLPGAAFGAPERLLLAPAGDGDSAVIRAGYSASGEAVVTWNLHGPKEDDPYELWAAIAPPGAAFGAPQRVAQIDDDPYALAVGADGRALVVASSGGRLVAGERAPGGGFGAPQAIAKTGERFETYPTAVLRPGGGAVIAWWNPGDATLNVTGRVQTGAFAPASAIVPSKQLSDGALVAQQRLVNSVSSDPTGAAAPHAVLTADGLVQLTWSHLRGRQGVWRIAPATALLDFTGGRTDTNVVEGAVRDADGVAAVTLADGSHAVAWTDSGPGGTPGRLHLAREGTPAAPEPAAPKVTVAAVGSRTLKDSDPLTLRVTCDAACDVYAQLAGEDEVTAALSLPAAGSRRLVLRPVDHPLVPRAGGKVRVMLRSGAPGAHRATTQTLAVDLRRARTAYAPRVLDLFVAVDGKDLVVRWHTATAANPRRYSVWAFDGDDPVASEEVGGRSRRSFSVRIRNAVGATKVSVYAAALNEDKVRKTTVEIQG